MSELKHHKHHGYTITERSSWLGVTYTVQVGGRTIQRTTLEAIRAVIDRLAQAEMR